MRRGQSSREDPTRRERWGDEEEAESSLQGRLEVSKERWRDEKGAESSLQGKLEAS
jgi:hypothetical protein